MKILLALGAIASIASIAGCGGSQSPIGVPDRGTSWMLPEAKSADLLYVVIPTVSVYQGSVNVYAYPQGTLEGQITNLAYSRALPTGPTGDCVDAKGNVYITDAGPSQNTIVEFAHGSTQSIRTLSVPGKNAWSCAVDPTDGDLPVTSLGNEHGQGANVAVFRKARGQPKTYTDSDFLDYSYCAYDNADDLFVDGHYPGGYQSPKVAELPRGDKSLLTINLSYEPGWLSGVEWDGKYVAIGQAVKPYILRYKVSGTTGTLVHSTPLSDATTASQFVFIGKRVIVTNQYFQDRYIYRWDVLVYNYPEGGSSTQQLLQGVYFEIESVALSRHK